MMRFKGWRTMAWNAANAVLLAMELLESNYAVPEAWEPYWIVVYLVGNVILRLATTTPVGKAE